jgi:hypothetical protein
MILFILYRVHNGITDLASGVPHVDETVDLRLEELMNLEITSRQWPDRRVSIGGSDGHLIVSADKAELIRHWKAEHGEAESNGHRASSRVRIAAARRKTTTPSLRPVSSVVCWLFKFFVSSSTQVRASGHRPYPRFRG